MDNSVDNEHHKNRMTNKKSLIDKHIKEANQEKGVLLILTGNGKGKSSSGFGMIARALGHGLNCAVVQFIKASDATGEELFFRRFPEVEYHVEGEGFTWDTQDKSADIAAAERGWQRALSQLQNPNINMVLLDELNIILKLGYLDQQPLFDALNNRPPMQHVIITGRGAPIELIEMADTVTDMREVKHAYQTGIKAQIGIEL